MLRLKKIAITGGIASGKTSVCQFFQELGAYVVRADTLIHELLDPNTDLGQQIIQLFGFDILQNGKINRSALAKKAFPDPQKLDTLEKLLHPPLLQRIEQLYEEISPKDYSLFVVEIPLLFEISGDAFYDTVIAVVADEAIARRRFEEKGFSKGEYDRRMKRHLSPSQKAARAHYVLQNNGTLEDLRRQVVALNKTLQTTT